MSTSSDPGSRPLAPRPGAERGVAAVLALYALARIGLLVVIAGLLMLAGVPIVIAVLVSLIVALPLSMLLFRGLRGRLDDALAVARTRRGAQRSALRAGLRGDPDEGDGGAGEPDSGDRPQRQADGGGG